MRKKLLSIMRSNTRIDLIKIMQRRHDITKPNQAFIRDTEPFNTDQNEPN